MGGFFIDASLRIRRAMKEKSGAINMKGMFLNLSVFVIMVTCSITLIIYSANLEKIEDRIGIDTEPVSVSE